MLKRLLSCIATFILCSTSFAQAISITTTNTPSICYNDGTLTITATGGTAPYIDSILSGPVNPNLTYPIALPSGQNHFINLPSGSFTIRVHDAAGHTGTSTASVAGTYRFPNMTLSFSSAIINVSRVSGSGLGTIQYAISSVSSSAGFGPYQTGTSFGSLCVGTYWVRMRDSCGNIYTDNITTFYYPEPVVNCVNLSNGTATVQGYGGVPPYTFTVYDAVNGGLITSNTTGSFSGLPRNGTLGFAITDSCNNGNHNQVLYWRPAPSYFVNCPFDSTIRLSYTSLQSFFAPYTFTCLNCTPVQTKTISSLPGAFGDTALFRGLSPGRKYAIKYVDRCLNGRTDSASTIPTVNMDYKLLSCRDISFSFKYSDGTIVPISDIDSVIFIHNQIKYRNTVGTFKIPVPASPTAFNDSIVGFIHGSCIFRGGLFIAAPFNLSINCITEHMDSSCSKGWNCIINQPNDDYHLDNLYLIGSLHDTIRQQPSLSGDGKNFYNVKPGTYTLVSDSGCSATVGLDTFINQL